MSEPRRSFRTTKGQHKSLDTLDSLAGPKKRQSRRGGRKRGGEEDDHEAEVIRCVCGATEDKQNGEPFIACDKCNVWQHNVCMGLTIYDEDMPDNYQCELCDPKSHTELLEGIAKGEKPWEARMVAAQEEKKRRENEAGKKKRGGRRKRVSDPKEAIAAAKKSELSTEPETPPKKTDGNIMAGKRKAKDQDGEAQQGPARKIRRLGGPGSEVKPKHEHDPEPEPEPEPETEPEPELEPDPESAEPTTEVSSPKQSSSEQSSEQPAEQSAEGALPSTEPAAEPNSRAGQSSSEQPIDSTSKKPCTESTQKSSGKRVKRPSTPEQDDVDEPMPDAIDPTESEQSVAKTDRATPALVSAAELIARLPNNRKGPVNLLQKNFSHALDLAAKSGIFSLKQGETAKSKAELMALELEREVHGLSLAQKAYSARVKTLAHNVKNNPELCNGLLRGSLSPAALAQMKAEHLASKEQQKEIQEIRAKVEKQAIIVQTDGPRLRRTHKGEEIVGNDSESFLVNEEPQTIIRRPSLREATAQDGIQQSPKMSNFDLSKVFAAVSPTVTTHSRRASNTHAQGPGVDPEVDRLLQDDTDSPPYSPKEDDSDIIWRGQFTMTSIAEFPCVAKHAAGANLKQLIGLEWASLFPSRLAIAGRIETDKALPYLCGLRYNNRADMVVTAITPAAPGYDEPFRAVINYFIERKRYGVVGDKGIGNVRDTYIVPVLPQDDGYPEFMLNLHDNFFPREKVTEPTMLLVFVYKDAVKSAMSPSQTTTPSAPQQNAPAFSPTSASQTSGPFAPPNHPLGRSPSQSPVSHSGAHPSYGNPPTPTGTPNGQMAPPLPPPAQPTSHEAIVAAGYKLAVEILGPDLASSPTLQFVLANASNMSRKEWDIIKSIYERDHKARVDLTHLSAMIEQAANATSDDIKASPPSIA